MSRDPGDTDLPTPSVGHTDLPTHNIGHANLPTHSVENQPDPLRDYNAWDIDPALREATTREGGGWIAERATRLGSIVGSARTIDHARLANRHAPVLHTHDAYGRRIDTVEYHPAYHALMATAFGEGLHSMPWTEERSGRHVARAALYYLHNQAEQGVSCPTTMTFAAVPALRAEPGVAAEWLPRLLSTDYDPADRPAAAKRGATMGMAMTEKQGGSDLRANTTRAVPDGAGYRLTGHKWFCSVPMSDAFLTLAYRDDDLTCFLVPRWTPDGRRNRIFIQRLKDKVGNRSNASSEIEYDGAWAVRVGDEGRGIPTILTMVQHTRLDCVIGSAGLMRQALCLALHHARHRRAFGKTLVDQPLMEMLLADLALDSEAAMALALRLARAFDEAGSDATAAAFARAATPIAKYWVCKRSVALAYEAMEVHGGSGYVEDMPVGRLYREAPLNGIWEGSGNVICLDVLRALGREPAAVDALMGELQGAAGMHPAYDRALAEIREALGKPAELEPRARRLVERLALLLQASLLLGHAPAGIGESFAGARLGDAGLAYGVQGAALPATAILERAWPQ